MRQVSSSFPSHHDEWDDSADATEYYDIDDHNGIDNDGYHNEYDKHEDHDGEWIDMSVIPDDSTFQEPELACMLEDLSRRAERGRARVSEGKKGWSKGESRDVLKFSKKEAGKGGRPENYKHVRLKLQSDRLNRGWRDQPAHGTNKGRGCPQLAQVDDLLARTRCFKCGELGHLARDCPQNKELTTNSETFFSGMVCNDSCNVLLETIFVLITPVTILVLVFLETTFVLGTLETNPALTMTLETNPVLTLILETGCVLKVAFKEMTKLSSAFEKMM